MSPTVVAEAMIQGILTWEGKAIEARRSPNRAERKEDAEIGSK